MSTLLPVDDALRLIDEHCAPLAARPAAMAEALGLVLAEDVASDIDSPPYDKAMMDGYAIRASDSDNERRVVEEIFAGDVPQAEVGEGEASRIMTGAPIPAGADAVVPVEKTERIGDHGVRLLKTNTPPGKHIMSRGELMQTGQVVLESGRIIQPAEIALLAEVGCARPMVIPRPTVAVLPTGAELVEAGVRPGPGQIRNSNGPMLMAAAARAGVAPRNVGVATDDETALRDALLAARDADVVLLSGGVSAGDRDLAPGVLMSLGVEQVFHKVAVKPGKPLWFGIWKRDGGGSPTYVFGLPGNPVSSFVCFHLFALPLVSKLSGREFAGLEEGSAKLESPLVNRGGRETFLPAKLGRRASAEPTVAPVAWRGSADLAGLAAADALIRLPAAGAEFEPGAAVRVLRLN